MYSLKQQITLQFLCIRKLQVAYLSGWFWLSISHEAAWQHVSLG